MDRRRTHRERRQLLLKNAPVGDRRRTSLERRSGLDRRVHPSLAAPAVKPRIALGSALSTRPLGMLVDIYA